MLKALNQKEFKLKTKKNIQHLDNIMKTVSGLFSLTKKKTLKRKR